jgi:WD40 repeat protein
LKDRSSLRDIIYDGHRFAYLFAPVIEQHPLLIYESALPFTPTDTTLHAAFRRISIPRIVGRVERFWSPRLMVLSEREQSVLSVAMTQDDSYIISGLDNGTIGLWDAVSGVEASPRLQGHEGAIYSVACSPDGTRIASGSDDCTIRLWDIKSATEVLVLRGHEQRVTAVCFSPTRSSEGMSLLSGSRDCTIRLWTVSASLHVDSHVVDRYASAINTVAFSPDGRRFVCGAADGTVRIRNPDSGSEILLLSKSHISIHSVAFSPNGQWIVSGSTDGVIRIWNAKLGTQAFQPLKSHGLCRPIRSLAFLPDGNRVISGADNGTIRVWDLERGKEDCSLREHPREVDAIVVSNDGRRIISGSKDHTIGIWDADYLAKVLETENPHVKATLINATPVNAITAMALSHNGACFAIGFKDKSICLFDTVKGAEMLRRPLLGHKDIIRSLSFSPVGGKMASGADKKDGCLRIWDTASGKQLPRLPGGGMGDTLSVAFSGNGQRVASGSTDTIIRIWDLRSNMTLPLSLRGHSDEVRCVAFSPDGTQIVSGSNDTTIRVWNTQSGTQVYQSFDQHESFVRSVAFSSDALQIFSMSTLHKVVYTWSPTDACGKLISKTKDINHRTSAVLDPFVLTPNGWIVDISLDRPVSKLPPNISILAVIASAASDRSLIIATDRGAVIIMHFQ